MVRFRFGFATFTLATCVASGVSAQRIDDGEYARRRAFLRPAERELAWQRIPWRSAFGEAVRDASRARKPVLLWAMNGHPLGCT